MKPVTPRKFWLAVIGSALATLAATLLVINFAPGDKRIEREIKPLYSVTDPHFMRIMGTLLGPPVLSGNRYRVLRNGDEIFPPMLAAIRAASITIDFESYIFWSGDVGQRFADALAERARAGVKVHVLLDWIGSSKISDEIISTMKSAGVEIEKYHPPGFVHLGHINNRTHRKLLIVDGQVGFTGGVGIADKWDGHAQDPDHWRDTHFIIEGPAVAQMQSVFLDNWIKVTGHVLHSVDYFPPLEPLTPAGTGLAQVFSSSPTGGSESMELMYLLSITAARQSIQLSSAYFLPDDLAVKAMVAALKRGVKLQIITPGPHTDSATVDKASRTMWGELLAAGAEIYTYQPTMFHCKVMVVDGFFVSTGSTNFDNRSFRLNDEANLNIYDAAFAAEQVAVFNADIAQSKRVTLAEWQARPFSEKLKERVATLIGPQL